MCDNMAVVQVITALTSKDPTIMHLLRFLFYNLALHNIYIRAEHVPGLWNTIADSLSRNFMQVFQQLTPKANPYPTPIPGALKELLCWTTTTGCCLLGGNCWEPRPRQSSSQLTTSLPGGTEVIYSILWQSRHTSTTSNRAVAAAVCGTPVTASLPCNSNIIPVSHQSHAPVTRPLKQTNQLDLALKGLKETQSRRHPATGHPTYIVHLVSRLTGTLTDMTSCWYGQHAAWDSSLSCGPEN